MNNSSTNSPWFAVSAGLLGLIVGYALASGLGGGLTIPGIGNGGGANPPVAGNPSVPDPEPAGDPATADDDDVMGSDSATITLIEFTDYQCPFCSRHYTQTMPDIVKNYVDTGKVKYVVRDFPLGFHPNAHAASEATECAAEDGKFWEMHDKLFEAQGEWSSLGDPKAKFKEYAKAMGLGAAFDSCLDNGEMAAEVDGDLADGSASGINGTPGFWIVSDDGQTKNISGAYPYATFQAAFDEMLNS